MRRVASAATSEPGSRLTIFSVGGSKPFCFMNAWWVRGRRLALQALNSLSPMSCGRGMLAPELLCGARCGGSELIVYGHHADGRVVGSDCHQARNIDEPEIRHAAVDSADRVGRSPCGGDGDIEAFLLVVTLGEGNVPRCVAAERDEVEGE